MIPSRQPSQSTWSAIATDHSAHVCGHDARHIRVPPGRRGRHDRDRVVGLVGRTVAVEADPHRPLLRPQARVLLRTHRQEGRVDLRGPADHLQRAGPAVGEPRHRPVRRIGVHLQVLPDPGRHVVLQVGRHPPAAHGVGAQGVAVGIAEQVGDHHHRRQAVVRRRVGVHRVLQSAQLVPVRGTPGLSRERDDHRQGGPLLRQIGGRQVDQGVPGPEPPRAGLVAGGDRRRDHLTARRHVGGRAPRRGQRLPAPLRSPGMRRRRGKRGQRRRRHTHAEDRRQRGEGREECVDRQQGRRHRRRNARTRPDRAHQPPLPVVHAVMVGPSAAPQQHLDDDGTGQAQPHPHHRAHAVGHRAPHHVHRAPADQGERQPRQRRRHLTAPGKMAGPRPPQRPRDQHDHGQARPAHPGLDQPHGAQGLGERVSHAPRAPARSAPSGRGSGRAGRRGRWPRRRRRGPRRRARPGTWGPCAV